MAFVKATKAQSKLRLALCGLAGSGKTWTMLAMATAMASEQQRLGHGAGRIAVIDTEHESASLYADSFDFDALPLDNHSPRAYVDAIKLAESEHYDFCIIDSLTHAWTGKNGALEQKDNAAARGGNSWTAWRDITPMHNMLVDTMLACRMHLFASMRTKMEYIQQTVNGKTTIEKVGLAAIQREGMEYEFTAVGDMELSNLHKLTISKTRIHGVLEIGDVYERPGADLAVKVYGWLMSGAVPVARPVQAAAPAPSTERSSVDSLHAIDTAGSLDELMALIPRLKELQGAVLVEGRKRYGERKAKLEQELVDRQRNAAVTSVPTPAASESTRSPPASASTSTEDTGSISVEAPEGSSRTASDALGQLIDTGRAVLAAMPDAPAPEAA